MGAVVLGVASVLYPELEVTLRARFMKWFKLLIVSLRGVLR